MRASSGNGTGEDEQDLMPMDLDGEQDRARSKFGEEGKEEEKTSHSYSRYIDRCKSIGRVGPSKVMMDKKSMYGKIHFKD